MSNNKTTKLPVLIIPRNKLNSRFFMIFSDQAELEEIIDTYDDDIIMSYDTIEGMINFLKEYVPLNQPVEEVISLVSNIKHSEILDFEQFVRS